jgi:hypothetical protein
LAKQKKCNGNDCGFAHLGTALSLHPHLYCIVSVVESIEDRQENARTERKFCSQLCQSFRATGQTQGEINGPIMNKSGRIYENRGLFLPETFKHKVGVNI